MFSGFSGAHGSLEKNETYKTYISYFTAAVCCEIAGVQPEYQRPVLCAMCPASRGLPSEALAKEGVLPVVHALYFYR